MKIAHLIKVRFDVRRDDITQEWLDNRYAFFEKYTLRSLLAQRDRDWILWINCQAGMEQKIDVLRGRLNKYKVNVEYSFGDGPLSIPHNLANYEQIETSDYVYVTRIDSDDMYAPDAVNCVKDCKPIEIGRIEASMFRHGYLYDIYLDRLGVYDSPSTPFHTLMIPKPVFIDPDRYEREVWSKAGDHSRVNSAFYTHQLPSWQFTVLIHDNNFISTFDYARVKREYVPSGWSISRFLNPLVVFDVDDFCDEHNCLNEIRQLKEQYPRFKCTLFTIPNRIRKSLLQEAKSLGCVELCPHGVNHDPNEEFKVRTKQELLDCYSRLDYTLYTKGMRPPGWFINKEIVDGCNEIGMWIAPHVRDVGRIADRCKHGYYACGEHYPYWHAHSHNTCGNWLKKDVDKLLKMWPKDQEFMYVSEAIMKRSEG